MPSITAVRLKPFGAEAMLLNISSSGVLVECAMRLRLGTALTVGFEGTFPVSAVEGRVARSTVVSVGQNGVLRYHVGIAFQDPMALQAALSAPSTAPAAAPEPAPAAPAPGVAVNRW